MKEFPNICLSETYNRQQITGCLETLELAW